jgi:sterol desaturase/sphingolipid hydroxylase (fatty acid hydroxylase superfamily)
MLDALSIWTEPLFFYFPVATAFLSAFVFMAFAAPLTYIAWKNPRSLRKYRIQGRAGRKNRDVIWPSFESWAVNNLTMFGVVIVAWPLLRETGVHMGEMPAWWVVILQLLFFVYLDDFLFYLSHRALHTKWLFRKVHNKHHRIRKPWAITGHYMHPLEYVITGAVGLVGPIVLGVHVYVLWMWVVLRQWEAAEGHCGYDFPWTITHLIPFNDGAHHHDFHHNKVVGNFAGFLPLFDGIFKTFVPGYREDMERRKRED